MAWALVTGATGGLGRALALEAARDGYDVILSDIAGADIAAVAAEVAACGRDAVVIAADLATMEGTDALWTAATDGREIDVLVNNAGLGRHGPLGSGGAAGLAQDRMVVEVNIRALTDLTALAAAHMRANGRGKILNIASIAAWSPAPNLATYHASKSYVLSLTRAVREELAGSGVSITALCPSPIATGFFDRAGAGSVWLTRIIRPLTPERVADVGWRALQSGVAVRIAGKMGRLSVIAGGLGPASWSAKTAQFLWSKR